MQGKTASGTGKPFGGTSKPRVRTLPFSDSDVEEGRAEWKNIPEAVRTAILALSRAVAESDRDIEHLRSEYNPQTLKHGLKQEIEQKANTEEVKQTLNSIAEAVEDRIHRSELEAVLGNYVREDDVVKALQDTLSKRDAMKLIEKKADNEELKLQLTQIHQRLDKLTGELTALSAKAVTVTDLSLVREKLERKVDAETFQAALQSKAGVDEVQNVLDKKVDLEDLESLLAYKVDGKDFEDLAKIIETKADQDGLDQLWEALASKVDHKDIELVRVSLNRKADNRTVESHAESLDRLQRDMQDIVKNLEGVFEENRIVIDKVRSESNNLLKELVKKPNKQDIAELRTLISKKVEGSLFIEELGKVKEEFTKDLRSHKLEFDRYKRTQDETNLAAGQDQESERKQLKDLVQQVMDQQNEMVNLKDQEYEKLLRHIQDLHETSKDDSKLKQQEVILELRTLKKQNDMLEKKKLNAEEARGLFSQFESTLKTKANVDEVQSSLNGMEAEFSSLHTQLVEEFANKLKSIEMSFSERLSKKAQAVQVEKQLATKIDVEGLEQTIENLLKSLKLDGLDSRVSLVEQKVDLGQSRTGDSQLKAVQVEIQGIKKGIAMKANLEDVLRVLDQKCDIDEVNKRVKLIKASLEEKCSLSQLDLMSKEQSLINEFLCSENLVARWKWSSGTLVNKNLIPWEQQCTNTLADNFLWSANDPFVTLVSAGYYEITLGVFSRKKPTCQVFLNGEPLLSMANSNSYVVHHSAGKLKDVKSALSGPTGVTMVEYFLLPHRARISISYVCDLPGEGFICIRRIT